VNLHHFLKKHHNHCTLIHILYIFQGFDPTGVLSAGPGEVELSVQPLARDHEAYTLTITPANIKLSAGGLTGKVAHPDPPSSNWSSFKYLELPKLKTGSEQYHTPYL
jgi:hypothetical protein